VSLALSPIWASSPPEKIVRLVYFDESGIGDEETQPITVVAAVIVHGDQQARSINRQAAKILKSLPENKQRRFEFKADLMFAHYRKFGDESRYLPMMIGFLEILRRFELPICWWGVDRAGLREQRLDRIRSQDAAFALCSICVEKWFQRFADNEGGLCISDDARSEVLLHAAIQEFRLRGFPEANIEQMEHLVDGIYFGDSKSSIGLQMADFASFFLRKRLEGDNKADRFFEIISPLFFRGDVLFAKQKPQM
jgi:Protein of unknown function (DUF3800)